VHRVPDGRERAARRLAVRFQSVAPVVVER